MVCQSGLNCVLFDNLSGAVTSDHAAAATYHRTALLLGLTDGASVQRWAEQVIAQEASAPPALLDLLSADPTDLSALRHALWPLVVDPEPVAVLERIFRQLHVELTAGHRGLADTITILRQMRSMLRLPPGIYAGLNAAFVAHAREGKDDAILGWLGRFADA